MKSPDDLPRLLDDPSEVGGELRLGLERMSSNLPSAEQLASLAARVGVAPNPTPANGHAPVSKALLKIAAGAGISGVLLWALLRGNAPAPVEDRGSPQAASTPAAAHEERSAPPAPMAPAANGHTGAPLGAQPAPAPPATAAATAEETAPLVLPEQPTETPAASKPSDAKAPANPRPLANPTTAPERATPKPASKAPVSTSDVLSAPAQLPAAAPPSETSLLRDARLALNGDPARALTLTEQHRREYPGGGFAQEREVIAITALAKLGRTSEARSRAERFRSAYPTSPYTERVDRAVPP